MTASPRQLELVVDALPDEVAEGLALLAAEFVLYWFEQRGEEGNEARDEARDLRAL